MSALCLVPPSTPSPSSLLARPALPAAPASPAPPPAFLGDSPAARDLARLLPLVADSDATALFHGETGVGKTRLAHAVHAGSARASAPFHVVDCGALPEGLVDSVLFGHERGAFTGAVSAEPGALEAAGAGTLFLDEVGELSLASQAKLLRVLNDGCFTRVGSTRTLRLRARVLAATNRDLEASTKDGRFRLDLFYRLSVVELRVPALRERGDAVLGLARQILGELRDARGRGASDFAPDAVEAIRRYAWPGNVRELRNAIERALVVGPGPRVRAEDLPERVRGAPCVASEEGPDVLALPCDVATAERTMFRAALRAAGGHRTRAAEILGVDRKTLYRGMRAHGLDAEWPIASPVDTSERAT